MFKRRRILFERKEEAPPQLPPPPGRFLPGIGLGPLDEIALYKEAREKVPADKPIPVASLKDIIENHNSFFALLILNDQWQGQLNAAINAMRPTDFDIGDAYKYLMEHGEIYGTPVYVLRASFCFWCAQYCQRVLRDIPQANLWYQLAIQHWICASKISDCTQTKIDIVSALAHDKEISGYEARYYKENGFKSIFFDLLTLIKEGRANTCLEYIISRSGLDPASTEYTRGENLGIYDAKRFKSDSQPTLGRSSPCLFHSASAETETRAEPNQPQNVFSFP